MTTTISVIGRIHYGSKVILMAQRKTAVTPVHQQWSYCSLALSHQYWLLGILHYLACTNSAFTVCAQYCGAIMHNNDSMIAAQDLTHTVKDLAELVLLVDYIIWRLGQRFSFLLIILYNIWAVCLQPIPFIFNDGSLFLTHCEIVNLYGIIKLCHEYINQTSWVQNHYNTNADLSVFMMDVIKMGSLNYIWDTLENSH